MYRFDHDELLALAAWLRETAADLADTQYAINRTLSGVGRSSFSVSRLSSTTDGLELRSADLAARTRTLTLGFLDPWDQASERRATLIDLWWNIRTFAGSDNDERLDSMLRRAADQEEAFLDSMVGFSPAEVAALVAGLPDEVGARLALSDPRAVAGTDGLPIRWRAQATDRLMHLELDRLRQESREWMVIVGDMVDFPSESALDRIRRRIELLEGWLGSDRTFIWFDPAGDGQLVEVVGDPEAAEAISVFVPGIGTELESFEEVASHARAFVRVAETMDHDVAVVAWLGYDAPQGAGLNFDAATRDNAESGYPSLVAMVDGLAAERPDVPLSVIGHSYGSVVTGWAATFGHLNADRIVIIGSPNVPADSIDGFNVPAPDSVYVGEAPGDVVVGIGDLTDGWIEGQFGLGHGYDPGDCEWGAQVFEVQDAGLIGAHSTYSSGVSANAIVSIMVGDLAAVEDLCD